MAVINTWEDLDNPGLVAVNHAGTNVLPSRVPFTGSPTSSNLLSLELRAAAGGDTTWTWSISAGTPPSGALIFPPGSASNLKNLYLYDATPGTYVFTLRCVGDVSGMHEDVFSFTVGASDPVEITTASPLPAATAGEAYSTTLEAEDGATPYAWSAEDLPEWLALDEATGELSGTPPGPGTYAIEVTVTDDDGDTDTEVLTLVVGSDEPWASTPLTAEEVARAAADMPMLVAPNAARSSLVEPQWRSTGRWDDGTDLTLADSVLRWGGARLYDGEATVPSQRATTVISATTSLVFDLASATIDVIAILAHDLAGTNCSAVVVEIADDPGFTVRLQQLASWTGDFGRRLVETRLGGGSGNRYTGVRYLRIVFTVDWTHRFRIGEVFLGRRYAPPHRQDVEIDERTLDSVLLVGEADDGSERRLPRLTRRLNTTLRWRPDTAAYVQLFRDWFAAIRWGLDPFLYIPRPNADERACYFCRTSPDFAVINEVADAHTVEITVTELAPFVAKET